MKRFWSFALALCLIFSLMPIGVLAEETEVHEHSWGEWEQTSAPTCTQKGTETRVCITCEASESRDVEMLEHSYIAEVTKPSCTEKGYTTYTCDCGDRYVDDEISATGHSWDKGKVSKMASTSADGIITYTCTVCGETKTKTVPKSTALSKPKITAVTNITTGVKVKWEAVDGAEKYGIWYKTESSDWKKAGETSELSFKVNGLVSNTEYTFRIRCMNSEGTAYTSSYSKASDSILFIAAPKISSISNTSTGAKIKWNAVDGAVKYRVLRLDDSGKWVKVYDTTNTYYTVKNLGSGQNYTFAIRCVNSKGTSYTSYYYTSGKSITYMAMPKISSIYNVTSGIKMKWATVSGAEKYIVLRKDVSGNWVQIGETTGTYYSDKGLTPCTEYTYTVYCVNKNGAKSYYDKTGASFTFIAPPKLKSVSSTTSGVKVKWSASEGAEKYLVMYKDDKGKWINAGETTGTSYTVKHLSSGKEYAFTVRCISSDGKVKTSYYDTTGLSLYYIAAPKPIVKNSVKGIEIKWSAVGGVEKYRVLYKNSSGEWTKLIDTANTSYQVNNPVLGQEYTYTVVCINSSGEYISPYNTTGLSTVYYYQKIFLSPSSQYENAYAYGNTTEQIQCRRIADALEEDLVRCGFEVNNCQTGDFADRAEASNKWGADLHVPLHTNACNGNVSGTRIFVDKMDGEDFKCAQNVFGYLAPITPGKSENISANPTLCEIKSTTAQTVYIESEFHDVKSTAKWIINHVDDIAEAICQGICDYYGVKYVA